MFSNDQQTLMSRGQPIYLRFYFHWELFWCKYLCIISGKQSIPSHKGSNVLIMFLTILKFYFNGSKQIGFIKILPRIVIYKVNNFSVDDKNDR